MPLFDADDLIVYAQGLFEAAGTPPSRAELVARMLISANLTGHPSHGIIRVSQYLDAIRAGELDPAAQPNVDVDTACYAHVNGQTTFGQVAALYATDLAIIKAERNGLGMIGCSNMNHVGRLGDYVTRASQRDLLAFAFCNGGGPNVAPFAGRDRVLGTNPIACSAPSIHARTIEIDFASAAAAEGKLRVAHHRGEAVKEGVLVDKHGCLSTDPDDFYAGGAILTIGEHKGSALSLMLEIMAGIFTGGRCSAFPDYIQGNGVLLIVARPDLFRRREDFDRDLELLYHAVTGAARAPGVERIFFPGEPEVESRDRLLRAGVTLDATTWDMLDAVGKALGVAFRPPQKSE